MKQQYLITILASVIVGGIGFVVGMKYDQMNKPQGNFANFQRNTNGTNMMGRNGRGMGFRPVTGQIISVDDKSITVKLQDGSSRIVLLSDSTSISKSDSATKADLKVGDTVAAFGTDNSDGSVTAQNVQLNPVLRNFGSPTPSPKP